MKMYAELQDINLEITTLYLTGDYKTAFNKGKQNEVENRIKRVKN